MSTSPSAVEPGSFPKDRFVPPPLPAVIEKLLDAMDSGNPNATEIAGLLSPNVGLVAQMMKIVNSPYYGLPSPIRDVRHAVAYLGLGEIKRVALTVAVMEQLAPEDSAEFERFWYHSFHTALTAKAIAKNFARGIDPEELYVAALLHDVGKLIYSKFFPEQYRELTRHCLEHSSTLVQAEDALRLPSHALFGAILCDRWPFADPVKQACMRHELRDLRAINSGEREAGDDLLVVCISNALSNLAIEELSDALKNDIREAAQKALDCNDEEFLLLMGEVYELKSEVQQFLRDF